MPNPNPDHTKANEARRKYTSTQLVSVRVDADLLTAIDKEAEERVLGDWNSRSDVIMHALGLLAQKIQDAKNA